MVLRKPTSSEFVPAPLAQAANNPPYPTTPTSEIPPAPQLPTSSTQQAAGGNGHNVASSNQLGNIRHALRSDTDDEDSDDDWDVPFEDDKPDTPEDIPAPLKVGGGKSPALKPEDEGGLPAALRVGPPGGPKSQTSQQSLQSNHSGSAVPAQDGSKETNPWRTNNPYLKTQTTGQSVTYGQETSQSIWGETAGHSSNNQAPSPVELPVDKTPVDAISSTSFSKQAEKETDPLSPDSKQPPLIPVEAEASTERQPRADSTASSAWNPGMDVSSLDAVTSRKHRLPEMGEAPIHRTWEEQQEWERTEREKRDREMTAAQERAERLEREQAAEEEWHRGEQEARDALEHGSLPQQSGVVSPVEHPPALPPRHPQGEEAPPPKPPRPQVDVSQTGGANRTEPETPNTRVQRQRKEQYSIKHIRWYDYKKGGIRPAPILTQNANGPCPLLALVNALILSTPFGEKTGLMETLRTRENVSLGFLLDAVFDELMSGRRGTAAQELPDVGDLYHFLITLHTGMNVNPRFTAASSDQPSLLDMDNPEIHPALRSEGKPGGFEETREMRLYSTFNIPLIHGWLPHPDTRAYASFDRAAKTYEDAQNVQFREEELEDKLRAQGLFPDEQTLFEDVHTIKDFFGRWPTQLTDYGLEIMKEGLKPGQVAILFRNDHFSTLYKEPQTGQILTLVTDAGYSSHEEIVWETLVDVNGAASELFSGDFRPVGNMQQAGPAGPRSSSHQERPIRSLLDVDDNEGWTTVENRRNRPGHTQAQTSASTQQTSGANDVVAGVAGVSLDAPIEGVNTSRTRTEQEDHDLALALQLQEEEEDRHRREQQRRRDEELSQQYIEQEHTFQMPGSSPRGRGGQRGLGGRTNRGGGQEIRPLIPPRRNQGVNRPTVDTGDEAPPPTYEQAANGPRFHPPADHPASALAPVNPQLPSASPGNHGRQGSAYFQNQSMQNLQQGYQPPTGQPPTGRRRSSGPNMRGGFPGRGGMVGGGRPGRPAPVHSGQPIEDRDKCLVM